MLRFLNLTEDLDDLGELLRDFVTQGHDACSFCDQRKNYVFFNFLFIIYVSMFDG